MKKEIAKELINVVLIALYMPVYFIGYILNLISKLLQAGSLVLMGCFASARSVFNDFWKVVVSKNDKIINHYKK